MWMADFVIQDLMHLVKSPAVPGAANTALLKVQCSFGRSAIGSHRFLAVFTAGKLALELVMVNWL